MCTGCEFRFEHPGTPSWPNELEPQATTWPDSAGKPRLHLVVSAHQKSLGITPDTANVWFHPQAILTILGSLLILSSLVTSSVESWPWPNWPLLFHPHESTSPSSRKNIKTSTTKETSLWMRTHLSGEQCALLHPQLGQDKQHHIQSIHTQMEEEHLLYVLNPVDHSC